MTEDRQLTVKKNWLPVILGFLLMPVLSYVLFETVTGNLDGISWYMAALNIGWNMALYVFLFGLTGSTRITFPAASVALWAISLAETFVVAFRDKPIMLWDVLAVRTAMTVTGNYQFFITSQMVFSALVLIAANLLLWQFPLCVKGLKRRSVSGGCCACAIAAYSLFFFCCILPGWRLGLNVWSLNETYKEYGYMLSTAVSLKYVVKKPPEGYSQEYVRELGLKAEQTAQNRKGEEKVTEPVNLICIMNESFAELKCGGEFQTNEEYFPFFYSLRENTIRGSLCVPVFGSMTSNTEFEFLTGDSMALLPANSIAYQFNVKPNALTMVSTLEAQGYKTAAMHPYPGENWNRVQCYDNMGFDVFLDEDFYEGCEEVRNYVSDQADYEKIIEMIEQKEDPQDRLFLFNVTMQNHGGYEGIYENFPQEIYLTGEYEGKYPKADQYLSLMKKSDDALRFLLEYFEKKDEPTMIVLFGDHQPSIEDEFYNEIAGMDSSLVPVDEHLMWYETPFIIWTNYEQPSEDIGRLGAVYLSSYVLEAAGLKLTPYNEFLLELSKKVPVIHPIGCYDSQGGYYTWEEALTEACPWQEELLAYECLVYNHSMDRKKCREVFELPFH